MCTGAPEQYLPLSPAQQLKLRQLTLVSMAATSKVSLQLVTDSSDVVKGETDVVKAETALKALMHHWQKQYERWLCMHVLIPCRTSHTASLLHSWASAA